MNDSCLTGQAGPTRRSERWSLGWIRSSAGPEEIGEEEYHPYLQCSGPEEAGWERNDPKNPQFYPTKELTLDRKLLLAKRKIQW